MYYVVYVGKDCHYCTEALKVLVKKRLERVVRADTMTVLSAQEKYNWKTVPLIEKVEGEEEVMCRKLAPPIRGSQPLAPNGGVAPWRGRRKSTPWQLDGGDVPHQGVKTSLSSL